MPSRQGKWRSLKNYQPCFVLIVDISHHPAFIATHIFLSTHLTLQNVQQTAQTVVFDAANILNERCRRGKANGVRDKRVARRPCRDPGTLRLDKQNVVLVSQQSVSDNAGFHLCIPGLLFHIIPYKQVFSYQTKPARVSTTLSKQPSD